MADSRSFVDKYPNESKSLNTYYKDQELGAIWGYVTHGIAKSQSEMDEWTKITTLHGAQAGAKVILCSKTLMEIK